MPDVVLDVEILVVDPVRVIEFERYVDQLLPEDRRRVQPALDMGDDVLEAHPASGRGRRVVDTDARDMRQDVVRFHIKECCVLRLDLFKHCRLRWPCQRHPGERCRFPAAMVRRPFPAARAL